MDGPNQGKAMRSPTIPISPTAPMDGLTADHTHQSITATLLTPENQSLLQLKGSTWNLMNFCFSQETQGRYKNNPWNIDERPTDYMFRKIKQLDKICEILLEDGGKDFMFLQEIDFFHIPVLVSSEKWGTMSAAEQQVYLVIQRQQQLLKTHFERKLFALGFIIYYSMSFNSQNIQQPLAMVINMRSLQLFGIQEPGVFPNHKNIFRGFGLNFLHLQTNRLVRLVCLHLEYGHDYSIEIPHYQHFFTCQNILMIMGGDANHAPNDKITGLINYANNITNIGSEIIDGKLIFTDTHSPSSKKCYDGFFASPTRLTKIMVKQENAEVFILKDGKPQVRILNPEQEYSFHATCQSAVGLPIDTTPPKITRRLWKPPAELMNNNNTVTPPPAYSLAKPT